MSRRRFLESFEQYVLEVISSEPQKPVAKIVQTVLFFLSKIYALIIQLRVALYLHGIFRRTTLGCLIVSIGNITVGGTGKTPVVAKFAKVLSTEGRKVAILSRGYRSRKVSWLRRVFSRRLSYPKIVSDGRNVMLNSKIAGDEPYMLARNLKNVVVLVDKNRVRSGNLAIRRFGVDIILLDDGFQYLPLNRRLDIVLIDSTDPFGSGYLLPRGTLREPVKNLARANIFFLTKATGIDTTGLRAKLQEINPDAEIIECKHEPTKLVDIASSEEYGLEYLKGRKISVVSGIARPHGFEKDLRQLGAEIVSVHRFADHHRYSREELRIVVKMSNKKSATCIITTEKDAVRFPSFGTLELPFLYLAVEIEILSGAADFNDCISRLCFS